MSSASKAGSDEFTHLGSFVMISPINVSFASLYGAITLLVMSLSVTIPATDLFLPRITAASARFADNATATSKTVDFSDTVIGNLQRSFETGFETTVSFATAAGLLENPAKLALRSDISSPRASIAP